LVVCEGGCDAADYSEIGHRFSCEPPDLIPVSELHLLVLQLRPDDGVKLANAKGDTAEDKGKKCG
jgi:hypothetical protein